MPSSSILPSCPRTKLGCCATVKVKDLDFGDEEEFTIVGLGDEDYDSGKILSNSPIGAGPASARRLEQPSRFRCPKVNCGFQIVAIDYRMLDQD